jgi:hypothetical protein
MTRWCFVLGLLTSCSFSLGGPDPARPRLKKPTCATDKDAVVIDGLFATAGAVAALALATDRSAGALVPAVFGAVFLGAAVHGSHVVDACRADNERYLAALREEPIARVRVTTQPPGGPSAGPIAPVAPVAAPVPPVTAAPVTAMARDRWADFWKVVQ